MRLVRDIPSRGDNEGGRRRKIGKSSTIFPEGVAIVADQEGDHSSPARNENPEK